MSRVKRGPAARRRRKKILKLARGYYGGKSKLFRPANEQVLKSLSYAYRDRRQKNVISVSFGLPGLMLPQDKMVCLTAASSQD